jgi:hypothetical protein
MGCHAAQPLVSSFGLFDGFGEIGVSDDVKDI